MAARSHGEQVPEAGVRAGKAERSTARASLGTPPSRRLHGAIDRLLLLALIGTGLSSIAPALAAWGWWFALPGHFRLQLFDLMAVCVVVALWRRRMVAAGAAVGLAVLQLAAVLPARPASAHSERGPERRLSVVHLNVQQRNREVAEVGRYLSGRDADVVLLAETSRRWIEELAPWMKELSHRYALSRPDCTGLALYSRHPIVRASIQRPGSGRLPVLTATVSVDGQRVTITSLHARPPLRSDFVRANRKLLDGLAEREELFDERAVLCGDFNLTPWSPPWRRFVERTGLVYAGPGLAGTWPASWPPLRLPIDHCFVSGDLEVVSEGRGPNVGSDHLPIHLEVGLPAPGGERSGDLEAP